MSTAPALPPDPRAGRVQASHLANPVALAVALSGGRYRRAAHLDLLSARLVDGATGERPRQIIVMPPRHGKSTTTSWWFPVWVLALWPHKEIILTSHGAEFASEWGRKVRNTLEEHWPDLGITLSEDSKAANRWHTKDGGGMVTAGVGGGITGRGADIFIIDDAVPDAEAARSETIQKRNWNWYQSVASTRLNPGGIMVVVGTRWDENDLIGKMLKAEKDGPETDGYDEWDLLQLRALAEPQHKGEAPDALGRKPGEALWPEMYPEAVLARRKRSSGPFWWAAVFQGGPQPIGGGVLKEADWSYWVPRGRMNEFGPVEVMGKVCRVIEIPEKLDGEFQSWDMNARAAIEAISKGGKPSAVSGQVWGRSGERMMLLDRWFHTEAGITETVEGVRSLSKANPRAKAKLVEAAANGPAVMGLLRHELGGFVPVTPTTDKLTRVLMSAAKSDIDRDTRAWGMQAAQHAGDLYLPHPALFPWVVDFRSNLGKFPAGGRDDTDAASQAWAHAQGPAWAEIDKAHAEALKHKDLPKNTVEQFEADIRAMVAKKMRHKRPVNTKFPGRNW